MAHLPYQKWPSEEFWIYHDFKRKDNYGWLETSEVISDVVVNILDEDGDPVAGMCEGATMDGTKALVKLKGGESGHDYSIQFLITTDTGQEFEDRVQLGIKE